MTVLAIPTAPAPNGRQSPAVERVLARLVDPQADGRHLWRAACPVHGPRCAFELRQRKDGSAGLKCPNGASLDEVLDALALSRDSVGPTLTLTAESLQRLDRESAQREREVVSAALSNPEVALPQLVARGFDPAVLPSPFPRAVLTVLLDAWRAGQGLDVLLVAERASALAGMDWGEARVELGVYLTGWAVEVEALDERCRMLEDAAVRRTLATRLAKTRALTLDSEVPPVELLTEARAVLDEAAVALRATVRAEAPTLRELLEDPANLADPVVVVPRLAWRGHATLLSGAEKAGKSTYLGAAAAAVSRGDAFLDEDVAPGLVLWFALDEPRKHTIRRLVRHDANVERVRVVDRLPQGHADVTRLVQQYRPALTILDTLGTYAAPMVESMNDRSQMLRALTPLMHLVRDSDTALVLVHHDKKTGGYSDSQAIGGAVDVILQWTDPTLAGDRGRRDVAAKGRVDVFDYSVRLDGRGYVPVDRREMTLDARILEFLQQHPNASSNAVETAMGGTATRVRDELRKLWERGAIRNEYAGDSSKRNTPKVWRLALPGEAPQAVEGARVYGRGGAA